MKTARRNLENLVSRTVASIASWPRPTPSDSNDAKWWQNLWELPSFVHQSVHERKKARIMSEVGKSFKRVRGRIYTQEDVSRHARPGDCWVTRGGKVYDMSNFVNDHPGGDDLILAYAGKDVANIMADANEHDHSDSAYDLLRDFQIGIIGSVENTCDDNKVIDEDFSPVDTIISEDYARNQFLDLDRPLIMQVLLSDFSKSFYLQQVHQPRHLPYSPRLFGPWYLEALTRTQWYVVPIIWLPISLALFWRSLSQQSTVDASDNLHSPGAEALAVTLVSFFVGNFIWTLLEYALHRFLFHIDEYLPDHPFALTIHFLLHGIHHFIPMDRLRLVMPPLLFFALEWPFTRLAYKIFPVHIANGIISGAFAFYVLYDCGHYALHHTKLPKHLKDMKVYHMAHHFKNYELGFGVTSKVWDYVFGTVLDPSAPQVKA